MSIDKNAIVKELSAAFSLDNEAAKTALILLEARAKTLDFTFEEYMIRYHPDGIAKRDENLSEQFQGYVQFLKDDASTVLRAGKGANFNTFVHECAHVFRRQLTGELREQAEKAFGVENGIWTVEKEELFAKGMEQWIKRRQGRDKTRADVYNKGKNFVNNVYRGMERIIDIDSRMEAVYENIFENDKYRFNKNEYEKNLNLIAEGKFPETPHVFLGMTPRIYEELGFQRLPMTMTRKHLYTTFRANGELEAVNYHDLGEEIMKQLPEQLKKPLCIVQSNKKGTDIISVISLRDKENKQIVIPVAYSQKGNFNGTEIDVNLVKTVFGMKGFDNWLNEAIQDNRLLYIDKNKTEPVLDGKLTHTFQDRSIRLPDGFPHSHTASPTTDVFGFLPENIAHYKEIVKKKYPERFPPPGERILYKNNENQLPLDFSQPVKIPLPNTPENFKQNFIAISGEFKSDTIEAARFILREMTKENRAAALSEMQKAGCTDKEGYHKYLNEILSTSVSLTNLTNNKNPVEEPAQEKEQSKPEKNFTETNDMFGSIIDWNKVKEMVSEAFIIRKDDAWINYLENNGVPKELVKQALLWTITESNPEIFTEGLKYYIKWYGQDYGYGKLTKQEEFILKTKEELAAYNLALRQYKDRLEYDRNPEEVKKDIQRIEQKIETLKEQLIFNNDILSSAKKEQSQNVELNALQQEIKKSSQDQKEENIDLQENERAYNESISILENAENELDNLKASLQQEIENTSGIGLKSLQQEIERQRKERNSVLSTISMNVLSSLEGINDIKKLNNWLESAENALIIAKEASLKEIKRQYDYDGHVEIGENILHSTDIPDRVSPQDIKQILIYNAQQIVDTINNKINQINYKTELFDTQQSEHTNIENSVEEPAQEQKEDSIKFRPFGAWTNFNSRLSLQERERLNKEAVSILDKLQRENHQLSNNTISDTEKDVLRRYSGFGGIYANNEHGVLYDFYTSPPVARLTWQLLEKSGPINTGAKILEPSCGTGVFFEYAPKEKNLFYAGVELDERTAKVARQLHGPDTIIFNQSFEAFNLSDKAGVYDHVIGNAPFGERSASLSALDMPEEKSLDNYFVSRSIDNLKEYGTMALIVAPGVLENKTNEKFRLSINKKAQFVGAVKLPNRSFYHTHTQVMPDILLFRKYPKDIQERLSAVDDDTFKTLPLFDSDFVSGKYFEKHPEHIAGKLSEGTGQWGNDEVKGDITPESLEQILSSFIPANIIPEDIFTQTRDNFELPEVSEENDDLSLSDEELKQIENKTLTRGAIKISEKNIYILSKYNQWDLVSRNSDLAEKLTDIKIISNSVHAIQNSMKDQKDSSFIVSLQNQLSSQLHNYQKKYMNLPEDDKDLKQFIRNNPAVQGIYETFLKQDDPLLTQENVYRKQVDVIDGHNTAVSSLLRLRERMKDATEENIRASFPGSAEALIDEMRKHDDIFITTEGFYQLREDFISGDAWKKIDALKAAAEKEDDAWKKEKLLYGAGELEKAVGWTPIEDADFSPRSSWVPQEIVRDWASNKEALSKDKLKNLTKNDEGKWGITVYKGWQEYTDPLIYYLNDQKQRSKNYDTESYKKEHDDLFRSFIANHENYRSQLESEYNRKFKTHIVAPVKTYPVEIAGWKDKNSGGKDIKPHQLQSLHHLYHNLRGISALGTGFGKTATGVALMSLLIQEAKAHRHWLQVPNNKIKDWIEEIHSVMPSLKIASIDPEEPGYSSRDKRYAKYQAMARSDADIILMPESSASEIQLSAENNARITKKVSMLYKMEKSDNTARQQEMAALKGEYKADSGKTNVTVSFEDFGCDSIFVDEAHRYKNLFSSTLSRETGMNDGRQSAKAMSLYKKCEYIREQNDDKNVYLLTATPLTNSPLEYYNMMQYVAPEELRRMGVMTIDGFIREFANIEQGWLYDWGSGQAKQGNILTGFKNLSTLQNLFFAYTDLQNNPEAVGLEKPSAQNHPHIIAADKKQTAAVRAISVELDRYKSLQAEDRQTEYPGQNFLTFYSQMRTASLDLELYDPVKYKNWKNPKLEALANNAFANYQNTKGGQVIFCDRVFSSDASFNIHEKIKSYLTAQGFKEKDIVIVNGFTKSGGNKSDSQIEKEVSKAIADYNSGKYKVIIGSTACIGEGVNLQKNSSAVHHFDIPFRPSDFIQRNGRVDRQGNEQDKVGLHTYLAGGTIDNYSVNLVQRKANWIDQMLRTKSDVFTNPNDENSIDADELLLALTEEWGDKDAAKKRKEALEIQKQEKIKEAQEKQMKANLKSLSLARGALLPLKENTSEYKKRIEQIKSLETSLKNNPVFSKHDLLNDHEPFLYSANDNKIYRKGDVIINNNGTYLVESFNFKKQELFCEKLENDGERKERLSQAKMYNWKTENIIKKYFALTDFSGKSKGYSYEKVLYHFEKTSKEEQEMIKNIKDENFYKLPEDKKSAFYDMHLELSKTGYNTKFNPVVFYLSSDGFLKINENRYTSCSDIKMNPFSPEGRMSILKALEKGIILPYHDSAKENSSLLDKLGKTIPDMKDCISQAIDKEEKQKQAKKQEKTLEKEILKKAAAMTGADMSHLERHVSVVGFR